MTELTVEFPFVEDLPKREKGRTQKAIDVLATIKALTNEKGVLIPPTLAKHILGVSLQRIGQLMDLGTLERVYIEGRPFITEESFVTYAKSERKAGRPPKVRTVAQVARASLATAKEIVSSKPSK